MARLATSDDEDALDIVQDAMFSFVRSYGRKEPAQWPPLFHRVLQSRITDWYRRTSLRNRFRGWLGRDDPDGEERNLLEEVADGPAAEPVTQLLRNEAGRAIEQALATLPLRQRQAFLLRAWEGLDVAATAQAMGCSEGSVKTHYFRAVHALRRLLEEYQ